MSCFLALYLGVAYMWCVSLVAQLCLTLCDPVDWNLPGSSVHGILQTNTGVGCHSLLQGILLTQRLNLGLLHCWWILYHLSYQGSPGVTLIPCQDSWKPINDKKEEQGNPYFVEAVCNHWQLRDWGHTLISSSWTQPSDAVLMASWKMFPWNEQSSNLSNPLLYWLPLLPCVSWFPLALCYGGPRLWYSS